MGFFSTHRPGRWVSHGRSSFELPVLYYRDDFFLVAYTADAEKVRQRLPCDSLRPVTLPGDRAVVVFMAANYIDTTLGPYGEVAIAALVYHVQRGPGGLIPVLLGLHNPGYLVLDLPVSGLALRDAGRGEWGYPKFIADIDFSITPEGSQCVLSDRDLHILTLQVGNRGFLARERWPIVSYSVRQGQLLRTTVLQTGVFRRSWYPRHADVVLGEHPVAEALRELDLSSRPIQSRYYLDRWGVLPAGEVVEEGVADMDFYLGEDREGRHQVLYLPDLPLSAPPQHGRLDC